MIVYITETHKPLQQALESELENNHSPDLIKQHLQQEGYPEEEIENAFAQSSEILQIRKNKETQHLNTLFSFKEILDRVGFGFVPSPFLNILFHQIGASYLIIGAVNSLKSSISLLYSSWIQHKNQIHAYSKNFISGSGILFGFSFFLISIAILLRNTPLFAASMLLASLGIVTYGDTYQGYRAAQLKKEKMIPFLQYINRYGLLLTGICLLLAAYLLQKYPLSQPGTLHLLGRSYPIHGYLLVFEITALCFILSGYVLSKVNGKPPITALETPSLRELLRTETHNLLKNPYLLLLSTASITLGATQVLGNTYYGLHIYNEFERIALKGFLNVGAIAFLSLIAALLSPWIVGKLNKAIGVAPLLVFGTLLCAILPLTFIYNPNLLSVGAASTLSVVGAAIIGFGHDYLTRKLLKEDERHTYFTTLSLTAAIPFLLLALGGSFIAQHNLITLFKILAGVLIVFVAPLYFILVALANHRTRLPL